MGVSGQRHALAALYPGERTPGTHWIGGWVGPRVGLDAGARRKILCPCRGSNFDRPARSQTLCCLRYRGISSSQILETSGTSLEKEFMHSVGIYFDGVFGKSMKSITMIYKTMLLMHIFVPLGWTIFRHCLGWVQTINPESPTQDPI
jgi:hypothetical protein